MDTIHQDQDQNQNHPLESFQKGSKKELLQVSLPIIISQACDSIMMFTDRYLLSPLGTLYPSASLIAGLTSFLMCIGFYGILSYITPLTGQYLGAQKTQFFSRIVHTGLILSVIIYPFVLILSNTLGPYYFRFLKIPPEEFSLALDYLQIVNIGILFIFIKTVIAGFFTGINQTSLIMKINFLGIILNFPVSKYLISQGMGVKGAAYGTIISEAFVALCFLLQWFTSTHFKNGEKKEIFSFEICQKILRFGTHTGLEFFILFFAFNTFLNLFHSYGEVEAFSITVAFNWEILVILPLVGLNIGMMGQVGQAMGAKNIPLALKITQNGLILAISFALLSGLMLAYFASPLIHFFKPLEVSPDIWDQILSLSTSLILLMPFYLLFDGTSLALTATLRASGDTRYCLLISFLAQWGCLAFGYLFKDAWNLSALDLWKTFILSLVLQAFLFTLRYKSRRWTKIQVV